MGKPDISLSLQDWAEFEKTLPLIINCLWWIGAMQKRFPQYAPPVGMSTIIKAQADHPEYWRGSDLIVDEKFKEWLQQRRKK